MNGFDKKIFKALNYFANNELSEINKLKKIDKKKYTKIIPKHVETYIFENKYVDGDDRLKMGMTSLGLDQLRTLERIKINQKTFGISITALVISLITFIINHYNGGSS
ncbi:MAG: hypothetical protein KAT43_02375 [Nanoarchaeota archaeon]|nr:hypothetical protein [Nanoarchaeota archaeon]